MRKRSYVVIAVAVTALGATSVGFAGRAAGWWGGEPVPDPDVLQKTFAQPSAEGHIDLAGQVDLSRARSVGHSSDVDLIAVPKNDGGYCLTLSMGSDPDMPITCDDGPGAAQRDLFLSLAIAKGQRPAWIIAGRISDPKGSQISTSGVEADVQSDGFFVTSIPPPMWKGLDAAVEPFTVLGTTGEVIRQSCVQLGHSPLKTHDGGASIVAGDLSRAAPC
jgi:hypothetical protein